MDKNKSPKGDIGINKEIKNIKIKSKDNESFNFNKSQNTIKSSPNKEELIDKNIKKSFPKNDFFNPSNSYGDIKPKEKEKEKENKILPKPKKTGNNIKEKLVINIPNKGKGRSLEKLPLGNNSNNNLDLNKKKDKEKINSGKKRFPNKHNSVGKTNSNYRNKNIKINNINDKMKQNQGNKNAKNKKNLNDNTNIDNMKNININEEKLNQNKNNNNYINYNIINNNMNSQPNMDKNEEKENNPFKNYNSVCVSINNNYNYNVSLEKPPNSDNYDNFINQAFIGKNIGNNNNHNNNIITKEQDKYIGWKEKIIKINQQKNNMNFYQFKKLNNTNSNFWGGKNDIKANNEKKNIKFDKADNININFKQKIKKINSSIIPGENNINTNNAENSNDDKKYEPKRRTGILGFLESFKEMLIPFNIRKKSSRNNTDNNNNSVNISKNLIQEKLNRIDDNRNDKNKNFKKGYNTISSTKPEINNNLKKNVYEKRKINLNNNKKEEYNYNYYSDGAYDSCPLPNNQKCLNLYKSPNTFHTKNNLSEKQEKPEILSYSHKNLFKNNKMLNNEEINFKSLPLPTSLKLNQINTQYKSEEKFNDNGLFDIYDIKNNNLYKKSNNNKWINDLNNKNIPSPLNDINSNSVYIKKSNKISYSPTQTAQSENLYNKNYNINRNLDSNDENEIRIRQFSFNNNNDKNNNYNNNIINLNSINIERENKDQFDERQKIFGNYNNQKEKYNSENIEENLNINAEKKIQEIKININYKKDKNHFNNTNNYFSQHPQNKEIVNNNKQLYSTMEDFLPSPKPKTEIESCIINFDKSKKKPMKVYENTLYNKTLTPNNNMNNNINNNMNNNINNNMNYNDLINNFRKTPLSDNYNSYSYKNIHDINNKKNIYSKPNNRNYQSDKNIKREKNLSFGDLNINNSIPIKKKILGNDTEKTHKINRLSDSTEFDNDINSDNSDSSQNLCTDFHKTQILQNSQNINPIYSKPYKAFNSNTKNNNNNNSATNSFLNLYKCERNINNKYNTDFEINNDREINMTSTGLSKSNKNINQNLFDIIPINNSMKIYLNKNNLNNTDNQNNNNVPNADQIIYRKKSNSSKNNNKIIAINNITPLPSNEYNLINANKINNIIAIIRPKISQKNYNFTKKLYNYCIKIPKTEKDYYFTIENKKIEKIPLKKVCLYTKFYYKILQRPNIKNHYIDKKRIRNKKVINLPKSEICLFFKKKLIINIQNDIIKKKINDDINIDANAFYPKSQNLNEVGQVKPKLEDNKSKEIKEDNKEENKVQIEKELIGKEKIDEFEENNFNQNINIDDESKKHNKNYSTPTHKLKEKEDEIVSPHFASKSDSNPKKTSDNKIISIEIQLNNKDKYANNNYNTDLNKKLSSSFNNIRLNTNESLYIKKNLNKKNLLNQKCSKPHNIAIENDKSKTYVKQHIKYDDINLKINKLYADDSKLYLNNKFSKSNKIICIDIDLNKEQKKLQDQKELKEMEAYKRKDFIPFNDLSKNLKTKIETITINYNPKNNIINNNYNNDKLKKEIILKLDNINKINFLSIVEEFLDLLTTKIILDCQNKNLNYNKIRLSFEEIINNEYTFTEIIINKAINNLEKIGIFSELCNSLCIRLTSEINNRGNDNDDLKGFLEFGCKNKFNEIIKTNNINDIKLLGIILFICELIYYRIISLEIGDFCFNKLYDKYNNFNEKGNINKYYYLDMIVEFLNKYWKIVYSENNKQYFEKIVKYIEKELNKSVNTDANLPEFLKNKIINLIKIKENQKNY